ncbi:MAG: UDP-glucose 4-epimerase GalE [Pseudomonadota bacterium]
MTVLVTGGAGYIGSHMVHELRDHDRAVVVLDNLSTGFRDAIPDDVPFVNGDIGDRDLVSDIITRFNVTSIIHFAGSIVVPESVTDPLGYYLNNTVKSRTLMAVAVDMGVKNFIFSSTAAVYGMSEANPVFEDAPLQPISPYGTSKMMTELMLRDTSVAHDLQYVVLRYFNVAGADPKGRCGQSSPNATHLIKVANQVALGQREKLSIFGKDYPTEDGTCLRDYIHVTDLVKAHKLALDYLAAGGESQIMNCGYGKGYSVHEVVSMVRAVSDVSFVAEMAERRQGDPAALVAGAQKIKDILNWSPELADLETIVRHAFEWEKYLNDRK